VLVALGDSAQIAALKDLLGLDGKSTAKGAEMI